MSCYKNLNGKLIVYVKYIGILIGVDEMCLIWLRLKLVKVEIIIRR